MYNEITLISDFQVNDINDVEIKLLLEINNIVHIEKVKRERERTQL